MRLDRMALTTIEFGYYAILFFVPLIWLPGHVELFQFNKMMAVYLATIVIMTAWVVRMIIRRTIFIRRTPLDLPIILYLSSQIISTILSVETHTSIWGYYSRFHGGLLSTISYILLYYAFATNSTAFSEGTGDKFVLASGPVRQLADWLAHQIRKTTRAASSEAKRISVTRARSIPFAAEKISVTRPLASFLLILLASATIVAIYGILEHFGIDEHYWVQDVRRRVFSTLGQPNWLAAFLVTVTPLTLTRIILVNSTLALSLTGIFYTTLLYTKSRSGLLGFILMYIFFWTLTIVKGTQAKSGGDKFVPASGPVRQLADWLAHQIRKITGSVSFEAKRISVATAHPAIINFLKTSLLLLTLTLFIGTPFTTSLRDILERFRTQTSNTQIDQSAPPSQVPQEGGTPSEEIRRVVWRGAIDVWRHWPLFGSGVETFAYSYYNFRPIEHNAVSEWDFLYNKAHNEYLNILATTGIFGLASFLLLQGWYTLWSLRKIIIFPSHDSSNPSLSRSSRTRTTQLPFSSSEGVGDKFVPASGPVRQLADWLAHQIRKITGSVSFEAKRISVAQTRATPFATEKISVTRPLTTPLLIALLSGYIGLSVAIFFGFTTVTDGLLLFLFPAFAVTSVRQYSKWRILRLSKDARKKTRNSTLPRTLALTITQKMTIILVLVTGLYLIFFQIGLRWYADRLFAKGKSMSNSNRLSEALTHMQRASSLVPGEPVFHDRLALDFARAAVALNLTGEATSSAQLAQLAAVHSDLTVSQNPLHLNFLKNRAATLLHLSTIDIRYRKFAEETLLRAAYLAPTDPDVPYNLGLLYEQEGNYEKALEQQGRAVELKPDYELPRIAMAQIYETLGEPQNAYKVYQDLLEYDPLNPTATSQIERLATMPGVRPPPK